MLASILSLYPTKLYYILIGVSNVMPGVRRMLVLIWSKESGVKEAVVEAYKRLYLRPEGPNPRYVKVFSVTKVIVL